MRPVWRRAEHVHGKIVDMARRQEFARGKLYLTTLLLMLQALSFVEFAASIRVPCDWVCWGVRSVAEKMQASTGGWPWSVFSIRVCAWLHEIIHAQAEGLGDGEKGGEGQS